MDFFPQLFDFGGVVGISHSLGEFGQFFAGQLAFAGQFKGKLKHARLFRARQMFDFLDDGCGSHNKIIAGRLDSGKGKLPQLSIPMNSGKEFPSAFI